VNVNVITVVFDRTKVAKSVLFSPRFGFALVERGIECGCGRRQGIVLDNAVAVAVDDVATVAVDAAGTDLDTAVAVAGVLLRPPAAAKGSGDQFRGARKRGTTFSPLEQFPNRGIVRSHGTGGAITETAVASIAPAAAGSVACKKPALLFLCWGY